MAAIGGRGHASLGAHSGGRSGGVHSGSVDAGDSFRWLAELERQKWAPVGFLNVVVHDGVVQLWGTITDERERQALIVAAQNIPGVKDVRDHLVWVEPMSGVVIGAGGEVLAS